jgi:SAM-dependent methyltransferase
VKAPDIVSRFYPETAAGGFSRKDGTVQFYQRVHALLRSDSLVLDFGAGRGAHFYLDGSVYRRRLRDLRGEGRRVIGADLDPVVRTNPTLDEAVEISTNAPLPFASGIFDLIVSDSTFEHIAEEKHVAGELDRVLKPGGWLCVRTPNRRGYVALANRIISGSMAMRLVLRAQPGRKAEDVFPAHYRMNTVAGLKQLFPPDRYQHAILTVDAEPRYHFNRKAIFRLMQGVHALTPAPFRTTLFCFLHKNAPR